MNTEQNKNGQSSWRSGRRVCGRSDGMREAIRRNGAGVRMRMVRSEQRRKRNDITAEV